MEIMEVMLEAMSRSCTTIAGQSDCRSLPGLLSGFVPRPNSR